MTIDDEIDAWHQSDSKLELHTWLGLTWTEYRHFVERDILPAHRPRTREPMSIDYERFARLAELARAAYPEDEVSIGMNADGMHFVTGKTNIVLANKDLDLFEAALLVLSRRPIDWLSTGATAKLRKAMMELAELWSTRGRDVVASGKASDDAFTVGEGTGMQNCANALRRALVDNRDS